MQPPRNDGLDVEQPSRKQLMRTVFDMSESELDICLCVMEGGEQTVAELSEQVNYDRSLVSRHLNHLVDLGVIEKRRLLRQEGGQVYIYAPNGPEVVRQNLSMGFLKWLQEANTLINSITREKVESMVEADTTEPQWKIYQE
jgi:predicted transcriptional regulator